MEIMVASHNTEQRDTIYADLLEDFKELDLAHFHVELEKPPSSENDHLIAKGDPVNITAIILALVSAGGALTIAVGKEGFLTHIAAVLDSYIKRKIQLKIKRKDGTVVEVVGPPKNIERILLESLQKESKE